MTTDSKNNKETQFNPDPLESEVAHRFSFALGVVAGFNAAHRSKENANPGFDELPEAFSLAGGLLDYEGGDSLLDSGNCWYLLELKRGFSSLRDELDKPRVQNFKADIGDHFKDHKDLMCKALVSHQFLYLGKPRDLLSCELATLPYIEWLNSVDCEDITANDFKTQSRPFTSFLEKSHAPGFAFSFSDLGPYFQLLNSSKEGSSGEQYQHMIGVVVTKNKHVAVVNSAKILELVRSAEANAAIEALEKQAGNRPKIPGIK